MNPNDVPANGSPVESRERELTAENERLRAALQEAKDRIHRLQQERDKYYEFTKLWIAQNCSEDDWADFNPEDYTHSFKDLIADLEKLKG